MVLSYGIADNCFTINLHNYQSEKIPTFFAELNLRELFELGRLTSKKVKLID